MSLTQEYVVIYGEGKEWDKEEDGNGNIKT